MNLHGIPPTHGFYYVATPYSLYKGGLEAAFVAACEATAELIRQGVPAFSPIIHSHMVAKHGGLDALDWTFWKKIDTGMMNAAHGLVVVLMPGWDASVGVITEIEAFEQMKKPIHYLPWGL